MPPDTHFCSVSLLYCCLANCLKTGAWTTAIYLTNISWGGGLGWLSRTGLLSVGFSGVSAGGSASVGGRLACSAGPGSVSGRAQRHAGPRESWPQSPASIPWLHSVGQSRSQDQFGFGSWKDRPPSPAGSSRAVTTKGQQTGRAGGAGAPLCRPAGRPPSLGSPLPLSSSPSSSLLRLSCSCPSFCFL